MDYVQLSRTDLRIGNDRSFQHIQVRATHSAQVLGGVPIRAFRRTLRSSRYCDFRIARS